MIGLDTNLVVRYLTQDDAKQSYVINQAIKKWTDDGETLWISQVTLCETFWVLERCYKLNRASLVAVLSGLLQTRQIKVEYDDIAWQALGDYKKNSKIDFVDCLIGRQNRQRDCTSTYTFDRNAAKHMHQLFQLLS